MKLLGSIDRSFFSAIALSAINLSACAAAPPPASGPTSPPLSESSPFSGAGAPVASNEGGSSDQNLPECKLSAPKLSDDPCSADADCGPSEPCHAPACVAKTKSKPAGPNTMCTEMLGCQTVDANRCGCYQGRCALIPPKT